MGVGITIFAAIGTILLVNSHAATPTASFQAEAGTRSGNTAVVSDTGASGGSAVKFTSVTSTWPDTTNTGVAGCPALTTINGNYVVGDNETLENKLVKGQLRVPGMNATVRCVKVQYANTYFPLDADYSSRTNASQALLDRVEVDCQGSQVANAAMDLYFITVRKARVYGCTDGYRFDSRVTIEDSLCSGLRVNGDENNEWHYDCSQTLGGTNVILRHNYFQGRDTSNILLKSDATPINDVLVENNYFTGDSDLPPSYLVYSVNGGHGVPTNVRFVNNKFTRNYTYGVCSFDSPYPVWTGNVWADTGQAINLSSC
ncbi:hypothetical protein EYC59_06060 [Candidatus Saccharibacteria bacterium]|nr:MAG: hypothetical protein EYC59_06060 [Candidatus Saccharibacteria bacterium]